MGTSTQVAATVKVRKSTGLDVVATESYIHRGWVDGWVGGSGAQDRLQLCLVWTTMLGYFSAKPYGFLVAIMHAIFFTVVCFPITFFDSSSDG